MNRVTSLVTMQIINITRTSIKDSITNGLMYRGNLTQNLLKRKQSTQKTLGTLKTRRGVYTYTFL